MNVFISADIEGTCGIAAWDEAEGNSDGFAYFKQQMSDEVAAACSGALAAGGDRILVKDGHDTARNINPAALPPQVQLNRGWSGDIYGMMSGIQRGEWDAVAFTGYHSAGGSTGSPLAHTMSLKAESIEINGARASEFMINAYTAAYYQVPVCFISGDAAVCDAARRLIPQIATVPVNKGDGASATCLSPALAVQRIEDTLREQLDSEKYLQCTLDLPPEFEVQIRFKNHFDAYRAGFYPGASQIDEKTVSYNSFDYLDILTMLAFVL